ncbi:MAG: hypothetical protein D5R97_09100 [Candidatus Syntrophonatronum acetioxidans]|uniref:Uncharacterized protein n=1 Tax=Candidatus Syntrophonatronum acetioxidans TaxID=1795816 RepID=A0A424YAM5_9FIRM|nr:MAG: hypothetical protein D5R97_09100 [Candidatus Syntrophonatronum acetioxidans]
MAKTGESIVKNYLEGKGLRVLKIPERDIKTPDFEVFHEEELLFYLEEKTLEPKPFKGKGIDPLYNSIAKHLYEATRQFKGINPDKNVFNVLSFTNKDPARSVNDLFITLTGFVVTPKGKMRWIPNMKRLEKDLFLIDLYLWFDQDHLTGYIWEEVDSHQEEKIGKILGL